MKDALNRSQQEEIFNSSAARPTTVIGAGSVGSHVVSMLASMGAADLTVYDHDVVESHNIPSSAFRRKDLGKHKVEALREIVEEKSGIVIKACPCEYRGERLSGTVVVCVDTMEARKSAWKAAHMNPMVDILVDTRTAAELVCVYTMQPCMPDDVEFYKPLIAYATKETVRQTCGMHGIVYSAMRAATVVCANLARYWQHGRVVNHYAELTGTLQILQNGLPRD